MQGRNGETEAEKGFVDTVGKGEAGTTGAVAPAHPRGETRQVRSCCTGNLSGPQDNLEGGEAREVRVEK